ncbi:MAG: tetratricopeptide repeat protein [Candidatus Nitrohelix vancouverensis]|uniref:Tetratricopeptide repeat protein n=1 Tax=Candidatus Nitrohelix vancouverensis TaxID=2705534 RepID=A0A7T0C4M7_9BACT|nr:MAG: tetratricopeptide repeat protein [Candidatus Nitrohelix vancouverensis]
MIRLKTFKALASFLIAGIFVLVSVVSSSATQANTSAIALLIAKDKDGNDLGTGSGFVVDPTGVLITNYHVMVDAATLTAIFSNGQTARVERVLKVDRKKDFAVVQLEEDFYSTLELGDSDRLQMFDFSKALGHPTQRVIRENGRPEGPLLKTFGFVIGVLPQAVADFSFIYTTAPFEPGFSGGPLLDKNNKVIGIVTMEGGSLNLALPINEVKPFINKSKKDVSYETFIEQDLAFSEADYYRGNFYLYEKGQPEEALEFLTQAALKNPEWAAPYYDMAAAHRDMGDIDQAIEKYELCLKINPNFSEALSNLGGFYFREGKVEEALKLFEQSVAIFPHFVQALSNLGAVLNKLERSEQAVPFLKRALRVTPGFEMAYFNLGNAYYKTQEWGQAEQTYRQALALGVDFLSIHWKLYEIYHRQGDVKREREELNAILQMDPENEKAKSLLSSTP